MIAGTLGRYFARRFVKTIAAVFAGVFALIYAIDVVEMLRRSGDTPGAVAPLMAWLSLLHTPIVAEQALPFAVLFGAMIAFLNLSRKLELVVARSAGVSVWQFIAPPVFVAAAIGICVASLYNPMSTAMKRQADRIEAKLFGAGGKTQRPGSGSARRASTANRSCTPTDATTQRGPSSTSKCSVSDPTAPSSSASTPKPRRSRTATGAWPTPRSSRPASTRCRPASICSPPRSAAVRHRPGLRRARNGVVLGAAGTGRTDAPRGPRPGGI